MDCHVGTAEASGGCTSALKMPRPEVVDIGASLTVVEGEDGSSAMEGAIVWGIGRHWSS